MYTNNVVLGGRLAQKPILKIAKGNKSYANMILLVNKHVPDPNKIGVLHAVMLPDPIKVGCMVWGELAEQICVYADKGALICIEGYLEWKDYYNNYGNKIDGNYVVVTKVTYLSKPYGVEELQNKKNNYKEILSALKLEAKERNKKKK